MFYLSITTAADGVSAHLSNSLAEEVINATVSNALFHAYGWLPVRNSIPAACIAVECGLMVSVLMKACDLLCLRFVGPRSGDCGNRCYGIICVYTELYCLIG